MKFTIILLASFFLSLSLVQNMFSADKNFNKFVDKEVIGIIIGRDIEEKLFKLYGRGALVQEGFAWCYYNSKEDHYIVFELSEDKLITGVIISSESDLWKKCKEKTITRKLATGKNIKLGDSPEDVISIYGVPKMKNEKGFLVFEYHTDYKRDSNVRLFYDAYLYFKNDRLLKLSIHDGN